MMMMVTDDNAGIIHKGDGSNVYVKGGHVMTPLLGDSGGRRLLTLSSAADGIVYVADLSAIRRLTPSSDHFTDVTQLK